MNERSIDPRRTTDRLEGTPNPETVDLTGAYQPADSTVPRLPAPPADAPTIPGYHITGSIAKGGMGRVYAGHDLTLDRDVAVKTLLPGADAGRFVTESKITARLPHPNIPPVHALGTLADGSPYLAMKLIRGRTLADLLTARSTPADGQSRFLHIFEQIAQAVGFAHSRGGHPPRLETAQRDGRRVRRGAGDGLGSGQGPSGRQHRRVFDRFCVE